MIIVISIYLFLCRYNLLYEPLTDMHPQAINDLTGTSADQKNKSTKNKKSVKQIRGYTSEIKYQTSPQTLFLFSLKYLLTGIS
jgi:hypothetical protein